MEEELFDLPDKEERLRTLNEKMRTTGLSPPEKDELEKIEGELTMSSILFGGE